MTTKELAKILVDKYCTNEIIQAILDKEFETYTKNEYTPLESDNIIEQEIIKYAREAYIKQFKAIRAQFEQVYDELNLTPEQREYVDNLIKIQCSMNEDGVKKINIKIEEN